MSTAAKLTDEQFFFAHMAEFLDGDIATENKGRFESIKNNFDFEQKQVDFGLARGKLQLDFQKIATDDRLVHDLHVLVEDDAARANHEANDIEEYSKISTSARALRTISMLILVGGLAIGAYLWLGPKAKPKFSALDALVYESEVMVEDPTGRLDFPTNSIADLQGYFSQVPDLGFQVQTVASPGSDWQLEGASVIDYEVQKILVAQFGSGNPGDKLFIYQFEGHLDDFPNSQPGNFQGLLYQTYATSSFNVIVWQVEQDVVGMIVGSRKAEELAQSAFESIGV